MDPDDNTVPGSLYVWVSRGDDGTEGVLVAPLGDGQTFFSMVFEDPARARSYTPFVRSEMEARGSSAQLVEFTRGAALAEVRAGM